MFSRSITEDSRSIKDTSRVIRMIIISGAPSCGVILMTLEVSFVIFIIQAASKEDSFRANVMCLKVNAFLCFFRPSALK